MNIILFILPILTFPLLYLIACLFMGQKGNEEKHSKRNFKIKKDYTHFFKSMGIVLLIILFITVVRREIIVTKLGLKDALVFLLVIGVMIKLTKKEKSENE